MTTFINPPIFDGPANIATLTALLEKVLAETRKPPGDDLQTCIDHDSLHWLCFKATTL